MSTQFDPTKYGATPISADTRRSFDASKFGATPVHPSEPVKKETVLGTIKDVAKELPGAMKQVFTAPIKHPIKTIQAVTAGAGDVGVGLTNLGLKLSGSDKRLPSLTKAFADSQTSEKDQALYQALGEGARQYSSFALGQKGADKIVSNPIARGVLGNVAGGQITMDADTSAKDRVKQGAFDAAFGIATEGAGPLANKFIKKQITSEEALTNAFKKSPYKVPEAGSKPGLFSAEYAKSQGYEPIIPDNQLPVIKAGKTAKESTVKYGSNPNVASDVKVSNSGIQQKPNLTNKGLIDTITEGKKTGEPTYAPPIQKSFDDLIKEQATPKFKQEVEQMSERVFKDMPDYNPTTKIRQTAAYKSLMDAGQEDYVLDVAMRRVQDPNLNEGAAQALLEQHYNTTKQYDKLLELGKKSRSLNQAGQTLSMGNLGEGADGPARMIAQAYEIKKSSLLKRGINAEKEIGNYFDEAVKKINNGEAWDKVSDQLIDFLTCA
jgi:hypothetical protein